MKPSIVWGLDIGGTKTALCAADEQGSILCRHELPTAQSASWEVLLAQLLAWGRDNAPPPRAIGVSCGGPLDSRTGRILSPPNLPGWNDVPVTDWLQQRLHVPAYLQNDANACALAEWRYGAGQGTRNMVFLTFGTGLGAGLILNGQLYEGTNGMAGEIGHIRMAEDGPVGYGKQGSLEGFCSGGGLKQLGGRSARELCALADQQDEQAIAVLRRSAEMLGAGLAILVDVLNPERIVIGSIYVRAQRWFRRDMERVLAREALAQSRAVCSVVPAALGEQLGDMAAITVAWNGLKDQP